MRSKSEIMEVNNTTADKEKALRAVLTCRSKREAAAVAGITERTLRNYFQQPDFNSAYKEAMSELMQDASQQAKAALSTALSVLVEITEDAQAPPASRISAARSLLEYGLKLDDWKPPDPLDIFGL